MKAHFSLLFGAFVLASSGVVGAASTPGAIDLVKDDKQYQALCDLKKVTDFRPRVCIESNVDLSTHLVNLADTPIKGITDSTGKNFAVFADASFLFNDKMETKVWVDHQADASKGCAMFSGYQVSKPGANGNVPDRVMMYYQPRCPGPNPDPEEPDFGYGHVNFRKLS